VGTPVSVRGGVSTQQALVPGNPAHSGFARSPTHLPRAATGANIWGPFRHASRLRRARQAAVPPYISTDGRNTGRPPGALRESVSFHPRHRGARRRLARGPAVVPHAARDRAARQQHGLPRPGGGARRHRPGQVLDNATIVVRNGVITAVGAGLTAAGRCPGVGPQGPHGLSGLHRRLGRPRRRCAAAGRRRRAHALESAGARLVQHHGQPQGRFHATHRASLARLRAALAVPRQGIFRGTASVLNLGDAGARERVCAPTSRRPSASSAPSRWAGCTPTRRWGRSRS
jgi:hypothetical protein